MKTKALILIIILVFGIVFIGCTNKPLDEKAKEEVTKKSGEEEIKTNDEEIDSLFEDELNGLDSGEDLSSFEDDLI